MKIPEKTFFKIGEVAKLLDVEAYVLRYWESEFDMLVPEKTKSGQRIYQQEDIDLLAQIRDLLYFEMYTIAGARRQLERLNGGSDAADETQQDLFSEAQQNELDRVQAEYAALREVHERLLAEHEVLQNAQNTQKDESSVMGESYAQLQAAYDLVCDERDVLSAQHAALQQENESLHLSLAPVDSAVDIEERNAELFEVIARLEDELRAAHRESDALRDLQKQQLSQEEERRRGALRAMRVELEGLVRLAG